MSSSRENFFRRTVVLPACAAPARAHLRAHAGPNDGCALSTAPMSCDFTLEPSVFRTLLLERLSLPLPVIEAACEGCGKALDMYRVL